MSVISIFEGAYFASPRENKGLIDKAKHDLDMFTFRNVSMRRKILLLDGISLFLLQGMTIQQKMIMISNGFHVK